MADQQRYAGADYPVLFSPIMSGQLGSGFGSQRKSRQLRRLNRIREIAIVANQHSSSQGTGGVGCENAKARRGVLRFANDSDGQARIPLAGKGGGRLILQT